MASEDSAIESMPVTDIKTELDDKWEDGDSYTDPNFLEDCTDVDLVKDEIKEEIPDHGDLSEMEGANGSTSLVIAAPASSGNKATGALGSNMDQDAPDESSCQVEEVELDLSKSITDQIMSPSSGGPSGAMGMLHQHPLMGGMIHQHPLMGLMKTQLKPVKKSQKPRVVSQKTKKKAAAGSKKASKTRKETKKDLADGERSTKEKKPKKQKPQKKKDSTDAVGEDGAGSFRGKPKKERKNAQAGGKKDAKTEKDGESIQYACAFCEKLFKTKQKLEAHELIHTGPISCSVCGKNFSCKKNLKSHEQVHIAPKDRFHYECDKCDRKFTSIGGIKHHKIITHLAEAIMEGDKNMQKALKPLHCVFCNKPFRSKGDLRSHERIHTGEKPFVCRFCGKAFNVKCSMKRHEWIHTGEKHYTCSYCGKAFTQLGTMKLHEKTHTGDRAYVCDVCGKAFVQPGDLKKHERTHLGVKPFKCSTCSKGFSDPGNLKRHEKTYQGSCAWRRLPAERKGPPYICQLCNKVFTKHSGLERHKLVHTGEKPFSCATCGKSFRQESTLRTHERTHSAVKDHKPYNANVHKLSTAEAFICTLCDRVFHKILQFKKHERIHQMADRIAEEARVEKDVPVAATNADDAEETEKRPNLSGVLQQCAEQQVLNGAGGEGDQQRSEGADDHHVGNQEVADGLGLGVSVEQVPGYISGALMYPYGLLMKSE